MLSRFLGLALLTAPELLSQSVPLFNLSTGLTCSAAVAAPSVVVDCSYRGTPVMTATVALASLLGNGNGFSLSLFTGTTTKEQMTMLMKRQKITDLLHIEVAINDALALTKDVAVP